MNQTFSNSTAEQAAAWIVRLSSDRCGAGDRKQFSDWIEADPNHGPAFDQVLDTWQKSRYIDLEAESSRTVRAPSSSWNLGWMWPTTAFASLLCMVAAAVFFFNTAPLEAPSQHYATNIGGFERVELSDGSVIELNTNTKVSVSYSDEKRSIKLLQGEAYFEVAKNKKAPFVVQLENATVTALGTAFNIHSSARNSKVIVTEGVVAVAEAETNSQLQGERAIIKEGQEIVVNRNTGLSSVNNSVTNSALSWRKRTLVLENIPLNTALEKLNRYLKQPVDISDRSLSKARVSGTFSLEQPEATLTALVQSFKIKQKPSDSGQAITALYIEEK